MSENSDILKDLWSFGTSTPLVFVDVAGPAALDKAVPAPSAAVAAAPPAEQSLVRVKVLDSKPLVKDLLVTQAYPRVVMAASQVGLSF